MTHIKNGLCGCGQFLQCTLIDGLTHPVYCTINNPSPHPLQDQRNEYRGISLLTTGGRWGIRGWYSIPARLATQDPRVSTTPAEVLAQMGIPAADVGGGDSPPRPVLVLPSTRITGKMLSYDQLVDELLMSPPGETQRAMAKRLGYSESWLSRIIASDAFQSRLAERIEKDVEPERREMMRLRFASIEEEARGVLLTSLKKLAVRLEDPAGVPDELVLRSAAVTSKLLGYGARQDAPPQKVEMHVHLEQLAANVRNLNKAPSHIEGTFTALPAGVDGEGPSSGGK